MGIGRRAGGLRRITVGMVLALVVAVAAPGGAVGPPADTGVPGRVLRPSSTVTADGAVPALPAASTYVRDLYLALLGREPSRQELRTWGAPIDGGTPATSVANGYAAHMTESPLPGTPEHEALLQVALGDHQVAPVAAEVMARTIGATGHHPAYAPGRTTDVVPLWGIPPTQFPSPGSAIVIFGSGAPVPPVANVPPRQGEDPHGDPRADPEANIQKSEFLKPSGMVIDVCGGQPCTAEPR